MYADLEIMRQQINVIQQCRDSNEHGAQLGDAIGALNAEVGHLFTQRVYDEVSDRRGLPRITVPRRQ